ncbi:MAG TPA: tripartite tricarboxylate transporter substrate-binding protein [Candidatus Polarisedimenticolia bacterium]|nr:tripartite tricarboxylate transporter substrate-binding protein [Candidatus Polarisedimenticolia bacterium]
MTNKPGASGILGLKYALSQKADGYTVVVGPMTEALASPYFQGAEPYDVKDLSFVASYMPQERVLFTTPDKPYKTFQEFIEYARKHPGEISVGSGGAQWAGHRGGEVRPRADPAQQGAAGVMSPKSG